ncbi:MAG: heat shock protein GrpE [Gemmataceae bacterium]|nr:heat shock protein GrpE [Gemmataceae bacterium]
MVDRTTATPAGGERRTGEAPEAQATPAGPEDLEALRTRVTRTEQQREEYLDLLQRSQADFENYQKRLRRDLEEERRYAHLPFARELLPVLDNLQRALEAGRQEGEKGPVFRGVTLVESQLLDVLRRFGITPIEAHGRPFDPTLHEAVAQQSRGDVAPGTVAQVLEPGYRLHDRVLRPARVVVAAPPPPH